MNEDKWKFHAVRCARGRAVQQIGLCLWLCSPVLLLFVVVIEAGFEVSEGVRSGAILLAIALALFMMGKTIRDAHARELDNFKDEKNETGH